MRSSPDLFRNPTNPLTAVEVHMARQIHRTIKVGTGSAIWWDNKDVEDESFSNRFAVAPSGVTITCRSALTYSLVTTGSEGQITIRAGRYPYPVDRWFRRFDCRLANWDLVELLTAELSEFYRGYNPTIIGEPP